MRHRSVILALCALSSASDVAAAGGGTVKVGQPAPDFELTMIDGSKLHLADLRGKVVVLNFWATWCGPCKMELPALDAYYRLRKDVGLAVVAVATQDLLPAYQLRPLFAKMAIPSARSIRGPYPILGGVPTNYVIDRVGTVRYAKAGAFDLDSMNALFVPLLNERAPEP